MLHVFATIGASAVACSAVAVMVCTWKANLAAIRRALGHPIVCNHGDTFEECQLCVEEWYV
jgi:hypothetical protein